MGVVRTVVLKAYFVVQMWVNLVLMVWVLYLVPGHLLGVRAGVSLELVMWVVYLVRKPLFSLELP